MQERGGNSTPVNHVSVSRWTMTYFALALAFLIAAQGLMATGYGFPATAAGAPESLVLVHVVTIGWLSLLMWGALFQFVPVLVAKPLRAPRLVLPALLAFLLGLGCLIAGFLQLAGTVDVGLPLLELAGVLLPLGFALAGWTIGSTLWSGRPLGLPARFIAVALVGGAATPALGAFFAGLLSGLVSGADPVGLRAQLLPLHVAAGFSAWLTYGAIGVSYRLLPMFMLSPDQERLTGRLAWWCGSAAVVLLVLVAPLTRLLGEGAEVAEAAGGLLAGAGLGFYAVDLVGFYRKRRRRAIELNCKAALGAFAMLYLSALLLVALLLTDGLADHAGALVYLVAFGWLTGLGLSQLYKIVPFLTWLECYGPVLGRRPTPRVQDLVVERRNAPWFVVYFAGVSVGTAALLAGLPSLFRYSATATLAATIAIVMELIEARRLSNVAVEHRLSAGTPRLFLPKPRQIDRRSP